MIETSSYRIHKRMRIAILALFVILITAVAFHYFKNNEDKSNGIFMPITLINQVKENIEYIKTSKTNEIKVEKFPCSDRQRLLLSEFINEKLMLGIDKSGQIVDSIWHNLEIKGHIPSCKTFPQVVKNTYKILGDVDPNLTDLNRVIKERFVENVSWEKSIFCIYGQDKGGFYLAHGNYSQCNHQKIDYSGNSQQRNLIRKDLQPLISLSKNQGQLPKEQPPLYLTIDSDIHYKLQQLLVCNESSCPEKIRKIVNQLDFVTITLIDADSGEILAVGCRGNKCDAPDNKDLGLLKGANIEAPPASTAKLFFGLAFAKTNTNLKNELGFQIKTSGQLDEKVTKRNEWWEKEAICSTKQQINCSIPLMAENFSKIIGWNQYCADKSNLECGKSSILRPLGINKYSPQAGRFLIQSSKNGPYINSNFLKGKYLDWNSYDDFRLGKRQLSSSGLLEKTSLVVQSVIGAGDNRTSSLGLAMLSAGLFESSQKGYISGTQLFKNSNSSKAELNKTTASAVLSGMQKVTMQKEMGWVGDGTANSAYINAFGEPCKDNCSIYSKTGTVSQQDKVYAGTSLFTALALSEDLKKAHGINSSHPGRNLAIGVISKPKQKISEHFASKLGMLVIKEIVFNE